MTRTTTALLAALLLGPLTFSAALAQDPAPQASQDPIVSEPLTLKLMGSKAPLQGEWQNLKVFKVLQRETNIGFTFDTPPDDGYDERKNLTFASGDLPDLFFGGRLSSADEVNYGAQGFLLPLGELIEQNAPNLQQLLEAQPTVRQSITTPDGNIYALPAVTAGFGLYPKLWLNRAWLEALGLEEPTTTEELYTVLSAFKTQDPNGNGEADEIPLTGNELDNWALGDVRPGLLAAFGFHVGYGKTLIDVQDGRVRFVPGEAAYQSYLTFLNRLYSEGLLDPDAYTQDSTQITAKGEADRLGMFAAAGPFLYVGTERNEEFVQLTPLTSPESPEPSWPKTSNILRGTFAITNSNPNPEATMRWVDRFYSEAGALLLTNGVAGEDYERTPAGGLQRLYPEGVNPEEHRAGTITPDSGTSLPLNREPVVRISDIGVEETNPQNYYIAQQTAERLEPYAAPVFPLVYFTPEEQQEVDFLLLDIEAFVQEADAAFVTGQRPLSEWDSYAATLEQIGAGRLVELYQAAYDRYVAAGQAAAAE